MNSYLQLVYNLLTQLNGLKDGSSKFYKRAFGCSFVALCLLLGNMPESLAQESHTISKKEANEIAKRLDVLASPIYKAGLKENMNRIRFVPNKGQYNSDVLYTFNTPEAQMVVFQDRLRFIALHNIKVNADNTLNNTHAIQSEKHIVDIKFKDANVLKGREVIDPNAPSYNYFYSEG